MPGGRSTYIPTHCRDAKGRKFPLFNPAIRPGELPDGTDFTLPEWQSLLAGLKRKAPRDWPLTVTLIVVIFGSLVYMLIASGFPWYAAVLFGTFPLWGMLLLWSALSLLASRTLGTLAFVNITEKRVVSAMLKCNRCPSCAYCLPLANPDHRTTCSECGAVWRSNKFNSSPPPPPSPCTSPAPSQAPPR